MKKFFLRAVIALICFINTIHGNAQQAGGNDDLNKMITALPNDYAADHKIRSSAKGQPLYLNAVNIKAMRDFKQRHKKIEHEFWNRSSTGEFTASFTSNGYSINEYYNKYGTWEATLKGYTEDKMSYSIRDIVKRKYYDFAIEYVNEILTTDNRDIPTYIVHIKNDNEIKKLIIYDDEMQVWKEYQQP